MKSRLRYLTHLLSAGILAAAAIGSAEASGWLSSGLTARRVLRELGIARSRIREDFFPGFA